MILLTILTIIQIIFLITLIIQITDLMRYNEKLVVILDMLFDIIKENNKRFDIIKENIIKENNRREDDGR